MANQGSNMDQSIQDFNQQALGTRKAAKPSDVVIDMDKIESDRDDQKHSTNDDNIDDQGDDINDGDQDDEASKMIPACGNGIDLEDKTSKAEDSDGWRNCMNW